MSALLHDLSEPLDRSSLAGPVEPFELRPCGDALLVKLRGDLGSLAWQPPANLSDSLMTWLEESPSSTVVVDLSQVEHGGAGLLGFLVRLRNLIGRRGGRLALSGVSDSLLDVLRRCRLDRILPRYSSVDAALEVASQGRRPSNANCLTPFARRG